MQIHKEVVDDSTYTLLIDILKKDEFRNFYLAGGTALALMLGHRKSLDLDFFSQNEFPNIISQALPNTQNTISIQNNYIEVIIQDVKVMFMYYAYPRQKGLLNLGNIRLADPIDIGLMKLLALQGRTTKKDIVDLYFLDQQIIKLEKLLEIFERAYPDSSFNAYDSFKKLLDLNSIDSSPMPVMLEKFDWDVCMNLVETKIMKHLKQLIA